MNPIIVIEQIAILAILMGVGFFSGRQKVLSEKDRSTMTAILTQIAMPALTISAFHISYSNDKLNSIIVIFILSFIAHLLVAFFTKHIFLNYPRNQNTVLRFGNIFSNGGAMGLPFIYAIFGKEALLYGSVYLLPFNILLWTYGENLLKSNGNKLKIKDFFKNPSIIAIIIGSIIFFTNIQLPPVIYQPISMVAAVTSPLAMILLGERISHLKLKETLKNKTIYFACFIKLIFIPLVMISILHFIQVDPLIRNIIVIMQSLPVAVLTVVLSQKHGMDSDLASKITVISHLLSVITIPIIALFL